MSVVVMTGVDLAFGVAGTAALAAAAVVGYISGRHERPGCSCAPARLRFVPLVVDTDRRTGPADRRLSVSPDPDPLWRQARDLVDVDEDLVHRANPPMRAVRS